jgi:hypothetical protein
MSQSAASAVPGTAADGKASAAGRTRAGPRVFRCYTQR